MDVPRGREWTNGTYNLRQVDREICTCCTRSWIIRWDGPPRQARCGRGDQPSICGSDHPQGTGSKAGDDETGGLGSWSNQSGSRVPIQNGS